MMAEPLGAIDYSPGWFARTLVHSENGWVPNWLGLAPVERPVGPRQGRRSARTRIAAVSPILGCIPAPQRFIISPHMRELLGFNRAGGLPLEAQGQTVQGIGAGAFVYRVRPHTRQDSAPSGEPSPMRAEAGIPAEPGVPSARESTPDARPTEPAAAAIPSSVSASQPSAADQGPAAAPANPSIVPSTPTGIGTVSEALFPLASGFGGLDLVQPASRAESSPRRASLLGTPVLELFAPATEWVDGFFDEDQTSLHRLATDTWQRETENFTYRRTAEGLKSSASARQLTADDSMSATSQLASAQDVPSVDAPSLWPTFRPVSYPLGLLERNEDWSLGPSASESSPIRRSDTGLPVWLPLQPFFALSARHRERFGTAATASEAQSQPLGQTLETGLTSASASLESSVSEGSRALVAEPVEMPRADAATRAEWPVLDVVHRIHQQAQRDAGQMSILQPSSAMAALQSLPALGPGEPLAEPVRTVMETLVGRDLGDVRTYVSPVAEAVGAEAVTTGTRVVFAPGKMDFHSPKGLALLGHELAHLGQPLGLKSIFEIAEELVPHEAKALQQEAQALQQELHIEAAFTPPPFTPPAMEFRHLPQIASLLEQSASTVASATMNASAPSPESGAQSLAPFITSGIGEAQNTFPANQATGPGLAGRLNIDHLSPFGQGAARMDELFQPFASRFSRTERTGPGSQTQAIPAAPLSSAAPDIGELARQVYALLKTQLRAEQERHQVYRH